MQTNLRDVEYFAAIAEHGQVQRAAIALGMSQPALSKGLRRLEEAMKAKLLKRTPKGVELTSVGAALLAQVGKLRLSMEDMTREIFDLSEGRVGHLRIGIGSQYQAELVPMACAALLKEAPRVTMEISVGSMDVVAPALLRGELDLIVTGNAMIGRDDLVREQLTEDEVVVYASANHRLARKKRVSLTELAEERWALTKTGASQARLRSVFAKAGLPPPKVAVEENAGDFRRDFLPMTDLLGFGRKQQFGSGRSRGRLVELPVKGLSSRQSTDVCFRKNAYLSPAAHRFIEILKTIAKEISGQKQ